MNTSRHRQRGVSLIEALVAFGVMAFGMMAVVGMQTTLRGNGDLARQRAEAVRRAQDAIEASRGFTTLAATANRTAYADLADATVDVAGENATYRIVRQVALEPTVNGTVAAQRRTLVVDVSWADRNGQTQAVRLASAVAGIEPALAASLVTAASTDAVLAPRGRHRAIPPSAVSVGVGRSGFVPPGQGSGDGTRVAWVFNNATGEITLCSTAGVTTSDLLFSGNAPTCGTTKALLLTGAVRFATDGNPADSPTSMANPTGPETPFAVQVNQVLDGGSPSTVSCFKQDAAINYEVQYYCAVPTYPNNATPSVQVWTGTLAFVSPLALASAANGTSPNHYRVCRYHEAASYANVSSGTLSQNYALIKAGNGGSAYACPTASTFVPRTWLHQPV